MNLDNFVDLTEGSNADGPDDELEILGMPPAVSAWPVHRPPPQVLSGPSEPLSVRARDVQALPGTKLESYVRELDMAQANNVVYQRILARIRSEKEEVMRQKERVQQECEAAGQHSSRPRALPSSMTGPHVMHPQVQFEDGSLSRAYTPMATVTCTLINLREFTIRVDQGRIFSPEEIVVCMSEPACIPKC
jgi:hypothetical protein